MPAQSRRVPSRLPAAATLCAALLLLPWAGPAHAEGIAGHVTRVDAAARCLWLEWDNDTEKKACWTAKTRFSILDTGEAATAKDVRPGSYVRLEGEEKKDAFWAAEVAIWLEASRPE